METVLSLPWNAADWWLMKEEIQYSFVFVIVNPFFFFFFFPFLSFFFFVVVLYYFLFYFLLVCNTTAFFFFIKKRNPFVFMIHIRSYFAVLSMGSGRSVPPINREKLKSKTSSLRVSPHVRWDRLSEPGSECRVSAWGKQWSLSRRDRVHDGI